MTNPSPTPSPASYAIPANLTQGIVNTLASLPWAQVNGVITPLLTLIKEQEAAAEASEGAGAGNPT